ncbi:MAG: DUF1402 family protein [Pseudomonadota bacterium]
MRKLLVFMFICLLAVSPELVVSKAHALTKVPPGNRSATQPEVPAGSISRTRATNGSFQAKYEKIRDLIASDTKLQT